MSMLSVCPYFHVHQPFRIKRYRAFDIGHDTEYFNGSDHNDLNNKNVLLKVAHKSYMPATATLMDLLNRHEGFRFALSFSGTVLDQFELYAPQVLERFQALVRTGRVEILADTYHHSLAFFYSLPEFERQVALHEKRIMELFGVRPRVFRNTELSYTNALGTWCEEHGYLGVMAEGWEPVLGWRSPNYLYRPVGCSSIKLLLKNYKLSDDIAFRFGNRAWASWPLRAETFASWVHAHHGDGETINLFMDFETFGEHQWEDTGIFAFLSELPGRILSHHDTIFRTPTETVMALRAVGELDVPHVLTWADTDRDLTAWTGNDIQKDALKTAYALEESVLRTNDATLIETWRRLLTSDHYYYMCTKWWEDGDVHAYFSPYESPYDAYIAFMNALRDLQLRVTDALNRKRIESKEVRRSWWSRLYAWFITIVRRIPFIRRYMSDVS